MPSLLPNLLFEVLRESLSPYINRFLSADTIVPGYANPQNLNRYSYVANNPLRYTDPTGHRYIENGFEGSLKAVEKKMTQKWNDDRKRRRIENKIRTEVRRLQEAGGAIGGPCISVVCLNSSESNIPIDLRLQHLEPGPSFSGFSYDFDALAGGLEVEVMALDLVLAMQGAADYVTPAYRQLKSVVPLSALEMGISSSLQSIRDADNNLDFSQRLFRSITVAIQTGATDLIASGYGAAGFTVAGPTGYVAASYATSITMDNNWDHFNATFFPRWRLGKYP